MAEKHVKGSLFLDYVRMIKSRPNVNWKAHLKPEDYELLDQMVLPSQWYSFESYQRMGVAVLREIAKGDMEVVRQWGRISMDELLKVYKNLITPGEPIKAIEKFKLLRGRFFDFEGLAFTAQGDKRVLIKLDLAFEKLAEEAYAYQMLGSFERLLELSGARDVKNVFAQCSWKGDRETMLDLSWQ